MKGESSACFFGTTVEEERLGEVGREALGVDDGERVTSPAT